MEKVLEHYRAEAARHGASPNCTMEDQIVRKAETDITGAFLAIDNRVAALDVTDVGCGNGYTLSHLAERFPRHRYFGFDFSPDMVGLAAARQGLTVARGDVRDSTFAGGRLFDVALCQRVLINVLDRDEQRRARDNILATLKPGGRALFIEAFEGPLASLNNARAEFGLDPIPPAHHNLYLPDDFFACCEPYHGDGWPPYEPNHLSTHFYVSRVLHPTLLGARPWARNSAFVSFMSRALPPAIGDYSPLKFLAFARPR